MKLFLIMSKRMHLARSNIAYHKIIPFVKNGGTDKKLRPHDLDKIIADRGAPVIKQSGILRISAIDDNISQPIDVVNKDFSLRYDEAELNAGRELSTVTVTIGPIISYSPLRFCKKR